MTEEFYAKSGDRILRIGDRYMCSSVDPRTEAERWLASQRGQVIKARGVIVLGLGAGYHVAQLRKHYPSKKILIFEQNERCHQFAERLFPLELFDVPIVSRNNLSEIIGDPAIQKVLGSRFAILRHQYSMALNEDWYRALEEQLVGRSVEVLKLHLGVQPGLKAVESAPILWSAQNPLDWRVFDRLSGEQLNALSDEDFFAIKVLRELIK